MHSSTRIWLSAITVVAAILAAGIWGYERVIDRHRTRLLEFFAKIEIGQSRAAVDALSSAAASEIKRVRMSSWDKYFVWGGDDWLLIVEYTNNAVQFAGIVSSDQLSRRPKRAPPWKQGALTTPRLSP